MLHRALIALLLASLCAAPALAQAKKETAKKEQHAADPVVARVNGVPIHRSEILVMRGLLPQQLQHEPMDKLYPQLINQAVGIALVTQAARKQHLAEEPAVKIRMALAQDQILQDAYFSEAMHKEITEPKLRQRYEQYLKTAPSSEEIEARHILLPTEAAAKAVIAELNKGADFATLAKEKSIDPTAKTSGGDLGWFSRGDMVPAFADAAFKLKKGQYTESPVKTQFGWHVIKVEDRRQAKPPTYEQMAPKLAQQMAQELAAARIKELASVSRIEVFQEDGSPLPTKPPEKAPAPAAAAPQLAPPGGAGAPAAHAPVLAPSTENLSK